MFRVPPMFTRMYTLFPSTALFRSRRRTVRAVVQRLVDAHTDGRLVAAAGARTAVAQHRRTDRGQRRPAMGEDHAAPRRHGRCPAWRRPRPGPRRPARRRRPHDGVPGGAATGVAGTDRGRLSPGRGPRQLLLLKSEEQTSELQSLMRISYAFFSLKKKQ